MKLHWPQLSATTMYEISTICRKYQIPENDLIDFMLDSISRESDIIYESDDYQERLQHQYDEGYEVGKEEAEDDIENERLVNAIENGTAVYFDDYVKAKNEEYKRGYIAGYKTGTLWQKPDELYEELKGW